MAEVMVSEQQPAAPPKVTITLVMDQAEAAYLRGVAGKSVSGGPLSELYKALEPYNDYAVTQWVNLYFQRGYCSGDESFEDMMRKARERKGIPC